MTNTTKKTINDCNAILKENQAIQKQYLMLRNQLEKTQAENSRFKQRIEQLASALQERDKHLGDLQQFELGFKRAKENAKELEGKIEKEHQLISNLQDEKKHYESNLNEHLQKIKQLENVVQFLRSKAETSHLESKQLQDDLHKSQSEVGTFKEKYKEKEEKLEALQQELEKEKLVRQEASDEVQNILQQWKQLQNTVHAAQAQVSQVRTEEKQKRIQIEQELEQAKETIEEKDHAIKLAQQHLAKKLKDIAVFIEKQEELQRTILELQKSNSDFKTKNSELQDQLDTQLEKDKKLREQVLEHGRACEMQARKWEEKYFQMHDRLQEVEMRNKELRTIEEKYQQMQNILNSLGLLAAPLSHTLSSKIVDTSIIPERKPVQIEPEPMQNFQIHDSEPEVKLSIEEQQSLFDSLSSVSRFKHSLFD